MKGDAFLEWLTRALEDREVLNSPDVEFSPAETLVAGRLKLEMARSYRDFQIYSRAFQGMERFYDTSIHALSAFIKVGKLTEEVTNTDLLCKKALEIFSQELEFENCSIMLRQPGEDYLTLVAGMGRSDRYNGEKRDIPKRKIRVGEGIAGKVFETGEYLFIPNVHEDSRFKELPDDVTITSLLSIPIRNEEGLIGVLNFSHPRMEAFEKNTIHIMILLSNYIGQMITITRLHQQIAKWNEILRTLAIEKERLSVALSSMGDGVITTDTEEKIILLNGVAENLTGWSQDEAIGRLLSEVFNFNGQAAGTSQTSPVAEVIRTREMVNFSKPATLKARDGRERMIVSSGTPIANKEGGLIGVILVFRDITELRKKEEELVREQKLESVGILAGGIAHDFNNLLTGILGNIGMAKMYAPPGELRLLERLEEAEKASMRAKALTQQLLTFSKGGEPVKKIIPVTDVVCESTVFALRGSNVKSEFDFTEDPLCSEIDEGQISQVIHNIVLNAQHAMPGGGTLRIACRQVLVDAKDMLPLPEGPYVRVAIQDEGAGIPETIINDIFDPYFTTKKNGSGLGLSTCYSIMKKHGGCIAVKTEVGAGTTFFLYLPVALGSCPQPKSGDDGLARLTCRVLVTDDEEVVRAIAGEILGYFGCEVEYACDGAEAIKLYQEAMMSGRPFDVVMLDLTIPGGMGGREAVEGLRKIDPNVRAIVVSGYSNDPIMAQYESYGFCGVVTKPYRMIDLNKTLQRILQGA
ncbi:MAG: hybrid sensor histidine kinase/response regulator [Thermodesulfovibrio sp.]|nr:hybrid sensor histidine kinase/response regulator [Thermodesulfovibrio sp.]